MNYNLSGLFDENPLSTDKRLWEEFRLGDRASYQKLYSLYLTDLYNYGYKIIPNRAVVTDQIQDLFIDLWKYKEGLSEVKSIKSYLYRSLRNRIIKEVSQNKYIFSDMEATYANSQVVLPFENKIIESQTQSETIKKLDKAFIALSKRQREVINLLFYEKLSYEEVADIMSINLRSVYTLAWKALSVLRKELTCLIFAVFVYLLFNEY
ncbi:RNA polymerase sigma factor (sigma-70 family) [Catalinimonas alkaloidigena]|uniref:RNA polymerase sigma factor n=1 Tax=Catalinimonas alkaloidigena TaxID=1075417 RepID=UPI0024055ECE|nr:sigma-70 family RNA polymerase sigma factor [Catalinimonas alkaloidigena]MDF9796367.1 RNA polymerase sigma factor (sigma-70 family) [Catalinimonas alkaloidigena]